MRELAPADIAMLGNERGIQPVPIKALRERHHALARCLGTGMSRADASASTGYSVSRISILMDDPTFKELIAHYEKVAEAQYAGFHDRASQVAITALDVIAERLEDEPENIPTGQALEIAKTLGDRTGHAPINRTQSTSVSVQMSGNLAAARERLRLLHEAKDAITVEAVVIEPRGPPE